MSENKNILVVDDDEIILLALRESLTPRGYQVVTMRNPVKALECLKETTFAVIVSDQRMAEMNGLEFLHQCKTLQPNASRILITGVQNIATLIKAINHCEVFRFVGKPWIREELLESIESAALRFKELHTHRLIEQKQNQLIQQLQAELEQLRSKA